MIISGRCLSLLEKFIFKLWRMYQKWRNCTNSQHVENCDDSWLQDDEKCEEASRVFEFIEIPSYVALTFDDWSEPVYFVKAEAKANCKEIMTDTWSHIEFRK